MHGLELERAGVAELRRRYVLFHARDQGLRASKHTPRESKRTLAYVRILLSRYYHISKKHKPGDC